MTIYAGMGQFQAKRNDIIEACAKVAEQYDSEAFSWTEDGKKVIQSAVAEAIRALKDKP